MKELVGERINGWEIEYIKNNVYYLKQVDNELNHVAIDVTNQMVINGRINSRNYTSQRFLKKYSYLIDLLSTMIDMEKRYNPVEVEKSHKIFRRPADLIQDIIIGGRI